MIEAKKLKTYQPKLDTALARSFSVALFGREKNVKIAQNVTGTTNAPFVSTYDNSGNFVSSCFASFSYFWLINGHRGDEHGYLVGNKGGGWLRARMYVPVVSVKGELKVHNFAFELEGLKFVWGDHG